METKTVTSTNPTVANALSWRDGVATNGRIEDKVRVTMECFDFNGLRPVTKVMTLAALKQLLAQVKASATYDRIVSDLEKAGAVDIAIDPTITIQASWASRA